MPVFDFDDYLEPVTVNLKQHGEVVTLKAVPAIPADLFPEFMSKFTNELLPLQEKLAADDASSAERMEAFQGFINIALGGLDMVLLDESIAYLKSRRESKENPIQVHLLLGIYTRLIGYYMSGSADDDTDGETLAASAPTDGESASSPSSATDGGTGAANSSPEDADSTPGPTTI